MKAFKEKLSQPKVKWGLIISGILIVIILIIIIVVAALYPNGKEKGAYISVPDSNNLQYRLGNGNCCVGNGWDDGRLSYISSLAGNDGQRKKLPESHLDYWGYGIEKDDCKTNTKVGILDVVGYLCTPTDAHSSKKISNSELCYPANLYEEIWKDKNTVNPKNYWANYVYKTVSEYKDYIKIWETCNEPDNTTNYGAISKWKTSPPDPKDLVHWYGSIFQYIRLLRITYEVAKKVDPTCFVATGGLGYTSFLDAIMRYTDNPKDGSVTWDYPAYGGAYFDCDAYHQYPQYVVKHEETGEVYDDNGSDTLAKKVVILKKNHHYTIKKHGFGTKYPDKIFVNTETGLNSASSSSAIGGDLMRRNWIIKLALYCIEYDVKQTHMLLLTDDGNGSGDYGNLGAFSSYEEAFKKLKSSSKPRIILKKMSIGKYKFDQDKTNKLRNALPADKNATGIVLRRKFPKDENETYNAGYIYSIWIYCQKEEISGEREVELTLPFDPLYIDWQGNEKQCNKKLNIKISSTPVFLIGGEIEIEKKSGSGGTSGFLIFLSVLGIILLILIVGVIGLFVYKKYIKKKDIPLNKNFFQSLLH